jgi:predicted transcriptional regulator with HTH domain
MDGCEDGFLDAESVRYEGPEQLVTLGLMRWES